MKPLIQIGTGASLLLVSLFAATVFAAPVPHTFTNGQPADAEQVNANFQNLSDRIDAVSTATKGDKGDPGEKGDKGDPGVGVVEINFDPYRHNFSSKTFRVTGNNDLGESGWFWQEVRSYDRTTTPGTLIETRHLTDSLGATQLYRKFFYTTGQGQDKVWTKREMYDNSDTSIPIEIDEYSPGLTVIKNTMTVGHLFSTHSINNYNIYTWNIIDPPPPLIEPGISGRVETRILIGQESTTANNDVYENCLKVLRIIQGSENLLWYCEGMGLVKIISNGRMRELVSTTP